LRLLLAVVDFQLTQRFRYVYRKVFVFLFFYLTFFTFRFSLTPKKFQQSVVANFLQSSNGKEVKFIFIGMTHLQTPVSYFNPSGRAYPDVAALAAQVLVWNGNNDQRY
jgi:hypothetical protein